MAEVIFVEPALGGAVDHVGVVEEEAGFVAVAEVLEVVDFHAVAGLALVEVIDELPRAVEPHEPHAEGIADAGDEGQIIAVILPPARDVAGAIDEPGDLLLRVCRLDLLDADPRGADEVHPPIIMRLRLPFLPRPERHAAAHDDGFTRLARLLPLGKRRSWRENERGK